MSHSEQPVVIVAGLVYFEVFVRSSHLQVPSGTERFVDDMHPSIGGAYNTAAVLDALGVAVELVYPRGAGMIDAAISHELSRAGFAKRAFAAAPDPALSIVIRGENDRAFLSRAKYEELALCPPLPPCTWLHISGLEGAFRMRKQIEAARAAGTKVSVAGSHALVRLESLRMFDEAPWDLLVINQDEAQVAAGGATDPLPALRRAASDVIVTRGGRGARGSIANETFAVDTEPVEVVDATGAGDAFCAGYLAGLANDMTPRGAIDFAIDVATRRVKTPANVANSRSTYSDLKHSKMMRRKE